MKAATRTTHAPGEPTRGLRERYLFVIIHIIHAGVELGARRGGFRWQRSRGTGGRLAVVGDQ